METTIKKQQQRVRRLKEVSSSKNNNNQSDYDYESVDEDEQQQQQGEISTTATTTTTNPPLFYAQDVRVIEYFTKMRELLSKTFEDLDQKITAGLEEREFKQRQHSIEMRARFLDAAAALTRRAEQLEDKVLEIKMDNNSLKAQLQLKSESEIRAAILADDLKAHVAHYRMLTQNSMIHGSFTNEQNFREHIAAGGNNMSSSLTSAGTFKRQHLLQGKNPNLMGTSSSSPTNTNNKKHDQQQQQQQSSSSSATTTVFQASFLLDVGGKRATRDVVSENAFLRERLMANEWKNDKFLRDALMSAHEKREANL